MKYSQKQNQQGSVLQHPYGHLSRNFYVQTRNKNVAMTVDLHDRELHFYYIVQCNFERVYCSHNE